MGSESWNDLVADKRRRQAEAIPKEWTLDPPIPEEQHHVLDIPRTCGVLTAHELEITDTVNIQTLLDKLARGEWSSVEVTTAFYKRAIIAQQLVSALPRLLGVVHSHEAVGQLSHRDICGPRGRTCQRGRQVSQGYWENSWPAARSPDLHERSGVHQGIGVYHR